MTEPQKRLVECLREMHDEGQYMVTAESVAERMYPDARTHNAHGQNFNLAAGVVGRMLRKLRGVYETTYTRVWQIVPDLLPPTQHKEN